MSPLCSYLGDSLPQLPTPYHIFFGFPSPECTFQIINGLLQLGYRPFSEFSTGLCLPDRSEPVSTTALGYSKGLQRHQPEDMKSPTLHISPQSS